MIKEPVKRKKGVRTQAEILRVARRLFAEFGFDGVSTRTIAQEAGINVSTLNYHTGGKEQLYLAVFQEVFQKDKELVESFCNSVDDPCLSDREAFRDALMRFVDEYIELGLSHSEISLLWIRRWLVRPGQPLAQIDVDLGTDLYRKFRELLRLAQEKGTISADFNMRYFMMGFTWMVHGFFTGGSIRKAHVHWRESFSDADIEAFKNHLKMYICKLLGLESIR